MLILVFEIGTSIFTYCGQIYQFSDIDMVLQVVTFHKTSIFLCNSSFLSVYDVVKRNRCKVRYKSDIFQSLNVSFLNSVLFYFQGLNAHILANFTIRRQVLASFCHESYTSRIKIG